MEVSGQIYTPKTLRQENPRYSHGKNDSHIQLLQDTVRMSSMKWVTAILLRNIL